jgi:peptidoglycan/LPS O-acetylase OafA/YrhL
MSSRVAIAIVLLLCAAFGILDGYFLLQNAVTPRAFDLLFGVVVMITAYTWYRQDAISRHHRASVFLGGAVILFSPLAIPYYLAHSRESGKKLKSVLGFVGLVVLCLVVGVVTTSVVSAVGGA